MYRRSLFLLLPLALLLAGCTDKPLPTAAPDGPLFVQAPSGPVVNSLQDDGTGCTEAKCTLRDAIAFASPGATITFSVTGTIQLAGRLEIWKSLTIRAPGAEQLIVRSSSGGSVFYINESGTAVSVAISGITITGGYAAVQGGGINLWNGDLTLENSIVSGNHAALGGGISSTGRMLVVRNTTISGNQALMNGGGIWGWSMVVENSTISGNTANHYGGGMYAEDLTLTNSTVSGNTAGGDGGIYVQGTSVINHTTISGNFRSGWDGAAGLGWDNWRGPLTLRNSIIANNTGGPSCRGSGSLTDAGYNLVEDGSCISASTSVSGDPLLGPLADNGGRTLTYALLPGSPAIDAIPFGSNGCGISTDQRGLPRPAPSGGNCDIGAFEVQPPTPTLTLGINANGTLTKSTGAATLSGTLTCSAPVTVTLEVSLSQTQTKGRNPPTTVSGSTSTSVTCNGSTTAWTATVAPQSGKFAAGAAEASASTVGVTPPVQASRTVQLR